MKIIGLFIIAIPFIYGCDATVTDTSSEPRATTEYSRTLNHARETADQLEKSLSISAQRAEDAKQ